MSLDVYLEKNHGKVKRKIKALIYDGNDGEDRIYSSDFKMYFTEEQIRFFEFEEDSIENCYHANITHNLNKMASEAGIYEAIWRPYKLHPNYTDFGEDYDAEMKFESSVKMKAKDIIPTLEKGLKALKEHSDHFKKFNPENGWGTYEILISFVAKYLKACKNYPEAEIYCCR